MLDGKKAFSGFAVKDTAAAQEFYGQVLGLDIEDTGMGLELRIGGGNAIFIYPKPDHVPATYTILNFPVDDIDRAVDELAGKGVTLEHYDNEYVKTDEKGVARGLAAGKGPDIAWFRDPSGNVLSVLQN